jgi:bifunctional DNase/RNase
MADQPEDFPSEDPEFIEFLEARLDSISVTNVGFIIFLKAEESDDRALPIFIGTNEAQSIALALNAENPPPRPLTHDLMKTMLESLEVSVSRVEISDLRDGTFYARIHLDKAGIEDLEFDARPSDAIALAMRYDASIFVSRKVFDEAAVPVISKSEDAEAAPDEGEEGEGAAGEGTAAIVENLDAEPTLTLTPAQKLQEELEDAIKAERYEEAARLRDAIKRLQN